MSNEFAVSLQDVGKMYMMYPNRLDIALDAVGLIRLFPWRRARGREFWALRNINLKVSKGERLGIIGRNGAGKSTMLKLLTGNLASTEGEINVNGTVQALLTSGSGFHPEFTGYENIRSSLVYQGLKPDQIEEAVKDIAEFTELADFLSQPLKLYSAGMQARLAFATATVLNPDILIVDEILGAGDAYFAGKSLRRMKMLVEDSGATVLIVSHAMDQILQYCDECIWMERGKVVQRGPALEVIKAYQEFIQTLEDRRLQAKNLKRQLGIESNGHSNVENNLLTVVFRPETISSSDYVDISQIELYEGDILYESLLVGDAQDSSTSLPIFTILSETSSWSSPMKDGVNYYRRITNDIGKVVCKNYAFDIPAKRQLKISFRSNCNFDVEINENSSLYKKISVPASDGVWNIKNIDLDGIGHNEAFFEDQDNFPAEISNRKIRRWPGNSLVTIEEILFLGSDGRERLVFNTGDPMTICIKFMFHQDGPLHVLPAFSIYRIDGIVMTRNIGKSVVLDLRSGEEGKFSFEVESLYFGSGNYVVSASLHRDALEESQRYDMIDRSYEFKVVDDDPILSTASFRHPGKWSYRKD